MTVHISRNPMTRGRFDAILADIGWRRDRDEACAVDDPTRSFVSDIDLVPDADGARRIMFETHRTERCGRLIEAVDCIDETEERFWDALGIRIEDDDTKGETA